MYKLTKDFAGFQKGDIIQSLYPSNDVFGIHKMSEAKVHIDVINSLPDIFDANYFKCLENEMHDKIGITKDKCISILKIWFTGVSTPNNDIEGCYNLLVQNFEKYKKTTSTQ